MTPITYFDELWQRCDQIRALHTYLGGQVTAAFSLDELLRAEWVARVGALDLYVHELVAQNMLKIFDGTRAPCAGFERFQTPAETILRVKNAATLIEAGAAFDLAVRSRLSRNTYQFPDDIAEGIRLISDIELWNEVALKMGASVATKIKEAKRIKQSLSLIVERRNKIVHEGDLQPTLPRTPWAVSGADLKVVEQTVSHIVTAMEGLI